MAASNQTRPTGNYNNIGADYLSPITTSADIGILDAASGSEYARFDSSAHALQADIITEFTLGAGVTVGGVKLSSNTIRVPNNTDLLARNAADSADVAIVKLNTSNEVIFSSAANTAATRASLGLGTISTQAASSVAITGGTIAGATITTSSVAATSVETDNYVKSKSGASLLFESQGGSGIYLRHSGTTYWNMGTSGTLYAPTHADIGSLTEYAGTTYSSGFYLVGRQSYAVSSYSTLRTLTGSATLAEVARGLCSLIADLRNANLLG